MRLEPFETGQIFAHEQTMSGPKADRLKLYHATGFNLSPVFGFYPDAEGEVNKVLDPFTRKGPPLVAKDHLGVTNRLWIVTDTQAIAAVMGLMGPKPIFIADGHHRYETGLKYRDEQGTLDADAPANFVLMMLVGMSDPGLIILPTHRLVSGLPNVTTQQVKDAVKDHFDIVEFFGTDATACWEHIAMDGSQSILGFGTAADGQWFAAKLRDTAAMAALAPNQSEEWRRPRRQHLAQACAGEAGAGKARSQADARLRPPVEGSDRRHRGEELPVGGLGAAGHDEPRGGDRRQTRKDAAEEHVLLPEAAHRNGVQFVEEGLIRLGWLEVYAGTSGHPECSRRPCSLTRTAPAPAFVTTVKLVGQRACSHGQSPCR